MSKVTALSARHLRWLVGGILVAITHLALADAVRVSDAGRRALSPEIAVGSDGAINVIWLDKGLTKDRPPPKPRKPGEHSHRSATDLYFSRSEDGGETWSAPVRVNEKAGEIWGFSVSKPRIGVGPTGTIHVFYPANDRSDEIGLDVVSARYRRSTDNGKTFSAPITINSPPTQNQSEILGEGLGMTNSFGTMGVAPDGTVITAWQNVAEMTSSADGADGVVAVSTDDGQSFRTERIVLPENDVCPCCQLTLTFDDKAAYLGLRRIYADGRDSAIARSDDGGRSFSLLARTDLARWDIDGCPLKPTELAVDGQRIYAATYTGGENPPGLYFTRSEDGGKSFGGKRQLHPEAAVADAPAMTVDNDGNIRLIWHAKVDGERRVYTAYSTDGGESFSSPVPVNAPRGSAAYPAAAVASDGQVYVTWQHENEEVYVTQLPRPDRLARN